MKFGRFFVTAVGLIAIGSSIACSRGKPDDKEKNVFRQEQNKALIAEGETLLAQVDSLRKELEDSFKIFIADQRVQVAHNEYRDHKTLGRDYNWGRLSLVARHTAKERLATLMTALTRVVEIDTKRHVYVTQLRKVLDRKASVESFQVSLNNFERQYGEQFNDPLPANSPVYKNL